MVITFIEVSYKNVDFNQVKMSWKLSNETTASSRRNWVGYNEFRV